MFLPRSSICQSLRDVHLDINNIRNIQYVFSCHLIEVVREALARLPGVRLDQDWAQVTGGSRHVAILRGARLNENVIRGMIWKILCII